MTVKSVRIELNRAGIRQLLASSDVADDLTERGERIAETAGDGVTVTTTRNRDRAVVFVRTETFEAKRNESENRALTNAINAGR